MLIQSMIDCGAKEWIKLEGDKVKHHRIYFSKESFVSFAKQRSYNYSFVGGIHDAINRISTKDDKCKAYYDVLDNKFYSSKASIQSYFNQYVNDSI